VIRDRCRTIVRRSEAKPRQFSFALCLRVASWGSKLRRSCAQSNLNTSSLAIANCSCMLPTCSALQLFKSSRHGSLYLVDFSSNNANLTTCLFSKSSMDWLWRRRLTHVGIRQLNRLLKCNTLIFKSETQIKFDKFLQDP
jgi:hypothetical protein